MIVENFKPRNSLSLLFNMKHSWKKKMAATPGFLKSSVTSLNGFGLLSR